MQNAKMHTCKARGGIWGGIANAKMQCLMQNACYEPQAAPDLKRAFTVNTQSYSGPLFFIGGKSIHHFTFSLS